MEEKKKKKKKKKAVQIDKLIKTSFLKFNKQKKKKKKKSQQWRHLEIKERCRFILRTNSGDNRSPKGVPRVV